MLSFIPKLPVNKRLPVLSWLSSSVSPNLVEPLVNIIDDETNSVWNSWAVKVPVTVKEPVMEASPSLTPVDLKVSDPTTVFKSVAIDALKAVNAPVIEVAKADEDNICIASCWVNSPVEE